MIIFGAIDSLKKLNASRLYNREAAESPLIQIINGLTPLATKVISHPEGSSSLDKLTQITQSLHQEKLAHFIHIKAEQTIIHNRLKARNDWVDINYAKQVEAQFQPPQIPHQTLTNNTDKQNIIEQIKI